MRIGKVSGIACCLILLTAPMARGYNEIVEKKVFFLDSYTTINGGKIGKILVGYETYGKLSANKDNVILLCHGSVNNSHFAGRYDLLGDPGAWDKVIGPGNIIDTDKYFVIASDSITNVFPNDPHVITTGPASIDPATGKRYAMTFPIVTIADFVEVQKQLLDSLGIRKLHAVMGFSMGGMQTMEWAARYPDMVARAVPVVAQAEQGPYSIELKDIVQSAIRADPNWNNGDYYDREKQPVEGLLVALKAFQVSALSYQLLQREFGRALEDPNKNPAQSWDNKFKVQAFFDQKLRSAAKRADANSWLYIAQALNLFQTGHQATLQDGIARIKAKVLLIPSKTDLLMFPDFSRDAYKLMKSMGKDVDIFELDGDGGHSEYQHIDKAETKLRPFLN